MRKYEVPEVEIVELEDEVMSGAELSIVKTDPNPDQEIEDGGNF